MGTHTFDRLSRMCGTARTRRAALGAFLGASLMGTAPGSAAKVQNYDAGKHNDHGKTKRKRHDRKKKRGVRGQASDGNHCIAPDGIDLNALYGVSAQIVTGFCKQVDAGEQWVAPGAPWTVSDTFRVVPKDFVQAGTTPLEDFKAKFQAVKFVIDHGTAQEQTVVFPYNDNLFTTKAEVFDGPSSQDNWNVLSPITLGTLNPLPVGGHVVDVYWVFSAMHCDGVGNKIGANCLPAGEFPYNPGRDFDVTAGHR